MKPAHYENFDLEFYKSDKDYFVKARSLAGEAKSKISWPITDEQRIEFISKIEFSILNETQEAGLVKNFGEIIFEAAFEKEIIALYERSLSLAESNHKAGLRIRLHLQEMPELAQLPWEYLYQATTNQFLCLRYQTPIVRYLDIPKLVPNLHVNFPLRLLVMISSPEGLLELDVESETDKIKRSLGKLEGLVEVVFLEASTVNELQKLLRNTEFHIFHFIGHGKYDEFDRQGWLAFEGTDNSLDYINAEQVGSILSNHKSLRLVVLNSCKGATTSLHSAFSGVAPSLIQQGIPAVVAMQFTISDTAAQKFSGVFYAALVDGLPVDMAVTEARVAMYSTEDHIEWGTPTVYMRSSDGSLFKLDEKKAQETPQANSPKSFRRFFKPINVIATLVFALAIFLILAIIPKSTVVDIEVHTKYAAFTLVPENEDQEELSLLYAGLWAKSVSFEKVKPLELRIDRFLTPLENAFFTNPFIITPDPLNGRIKFASPSADISFQEIICNPYSQVKLRLDEGLLYLEIDNITNKVYQTISLGEQVEITTQECSVKDAQNREFRQLFNNSVTVRPHDFSRSVNLFVEEKHLFTMIDPAEERTDSKTQFLVQQLVEDLQFSRNVFLNSKIIEKSFIDSIIVKRNFPPDKTTFSSGDSEDLRLIAKPNKFVIYDLSKEKNSLKISAQGRLNSLKVGRGELMNEMIYKYLFFIKEHPAVSILIACIGWILALLNPFGSRIFGKN